MGTHTVKLLYRNNNARVTHIFTAKVSKYSSGRGGMALATRQARCQGMAMARHIQRRQKGWMAGQKRSASGELLGEGRRCNVGPPDPECLS